MTTKIFAILITLPWPAAELSPNGRDRWGRIKSTTAARDMARLITLEQVGEFLPLKQPKCITMTIDLYPPNKRRADWDNAVGRLKSAQDGICDALGWDDGLITCVTVRKHPPIEGGAVRYAIGEGE